MKTLCGLFLATLVFAGCGAGSDSTADIQAKVDAGGTITFPPGTYLLTRTIVVGKSNTVIQGAGPETVFLFKPALPQVHCVNDRAFTTPCDAGNTPRRRIAGPIAVGDKGFGASDDVSDLHPGDWLIITGNDRIPGEVVAIDWAQVASISGSSVQVQTPFRTAFPNARTWDPDHSGLGFFKLPQLVEGAQFRNFTVVAPDSGQGLLAFLSLQRSTL